MCMQIVIATPFPMNWVSINVCFVLFCGEKLLLQSSVSESEQLLILFHFNLSLN